MLLNTFCILDVACCTPRSTISEAAHLMRRKHTGDLVVVADDELKEEPLGVITDRDIVIEVLAKGLDPATTLVGSVIRTPVVIAREDEDITQAMERMRTHGVRRMPVVGSRGRLIGIVTVDDVLKQLAMQTNMLTDIVAREQGHEERQRR
jgi:CBS domain-containing protein